MKIIRCRTRLKSKKPCNHDVSGHVYCGSGPCIFCKCPEFTPPKKS